MVDKPAKKTETAKAADRHIERERPQRLPPMNDLADAVHEPEPPPKAPPAEPAAPPERVGRVQITAAPPQAPAAAAAPVDRKNLPPGRVDPFTAMARTMLKRDQPAQQAAEPPAGPKEPFPPAKK